MQERVVITGLGVISPIGLDINSFYQNLLAGKSGVKPISFFDTTNHSVKIAAEAQDFNPENYIEKKELARTDRVMQLALAVSIEAIKDAGLDFTKLDVEKIGVFLTSGIGGIKSFEDEVAVYLQKGPSRISPFLIPKLIIDSVPAYVSLKYGLKGGTSSNVSACASATQTIGDAYEAIKRGDLDIILAGGADASITPTAIGAFANMRALSTRNDQPEKASRPFDKERDGFVMGEGAAILVLESLSSAKRRGAKIYGEFLSQAITADAYHITAPDPEALQIIRVMDLAIKKAGLSVNDIDYINAHGTSTPANDKTETYAIKKLFVNKAYEINISSTKSMIGHLLGAAGAAEMVASVLTLQNNVIFPTTNYENKDPECDLNYTPNQAVKKEVNYILKNSFGFGGHNVSLVVGKFKE